MHTTNFYLDLLKDFSHEPTVKQDNALQMVSKFLLSQNKILACYNFDN